jgi:serine/threonine protein kinase
MMDYSTREDGDGDGNSVPVHSNGKDENVHDSGLHGLDDDHNNNNNNNNNNNKQGVSTQTGEEAGCESIPSADSHPENPVNMDPNAIEMTISAAPLISGITSQDIHEDEELAMMSKLGDYAGDIDHTYGKENIHDTENVFGVSADDYHDCGDGIGRTVNEADYEPSKMASLTDSSESLPPPPPPAPRPYSESADLDSEKPKRTPSVFESIVRAFSPLRNQSVTGTGTGAGTGAGGGAAGNHTSEGRSSAPSKRPEGEAQSAIRELGGYENRDLKTQQDVQVQRDAASGKDKGVVKLARCKNCGESISRDIEEIEKHMETCVGYLMRSASIAAPGERTASLPVSLITSTSIGGLPRRPDLATASTRIIYRTSRSPNKRFRPREVCALQDAFRDSDGTYYSYEVSLRHCDVRGMPGYVTADVLLLMHVAKPIKGSKSTCEITIISQVDTRAKGGMLMSLVQNEGKKKVGAMNRADLVRELETSGNLQDILKREKREDEEGQIVSLDDFELLAVLGRGGFGKVMQVKHKTTGKVYAMKILKKMELRRRKQVERTQTERSILAAVKHPFIVCLHYAFQNPQKLYMVMDFVQGGDFFTLMRKFRRLPEDWVRLYIAEIAMALQHLHDMDIVYRDLKPENILLCGDGHLKLTDFGLSRYFEMRPPAAEDIVGDKNPLTRSFCGTEQYMSPEMLLQQGHNFRMDWWCVGLLMHEMLSARHPFHGPSHYDTLRNMVTKQPVIDTKLSSTAASCVRALLIKNPRARMCSSAGTKELKYHPFFAVLNWDDVLHLKVKMPYAPEITGDTDISSFETTFTRELPVDSVVKESEANRSKKATNSGFMGMLFGSRPQVPNPQDDEDQFKGFAFAKEPKDMECLNGDAVDTTNTSEVSTQE